MNTRRTFLKGLAALLPAGLVGRCAVAGEAEPVHVPVAKGEDQHGEDLVITGRLDLTEVRRQVEAMQKIDVALLDLRKAMTIHG